MKAKAKPLLRFRVYVNPMGRTRPDTFYLPFYYWCTVWRYKWQAQARMRELNMKLGPTEDPAGACASWEHVYKDDQGEVTSILPDMGEIILCLKYSGSSTIYHECGHAAMRLVELIDKYKLPDVETQEERLCLTIGWMGRQIVKRLVAHDKRIESTKRHLRLFVLFLWLRRIAQ